MHASTVPRNTGRLTSMHSTVYCSLALYSTVLDSTSTSTILDKRLLC